LAVLAAAAVVAAGGGLFAVEVFLASQAIAYAGHGLAPRLGDGVAAFLAVGAARPLAHLAAHALDRVLDGRVDLVVDGVVAGPAGSHGRTSVCRRAKAYPRIWGCPIDYKAVSRRSPDTRY